MFGRSLFHWLAARMARRWRPEAGKHLGPSEHLGRRIFEEAKLAGVADQPNFATLNIEHFRESRDPEISLDRLGRAAVEPKVRAYLAPKCKWQATTFNKQKRFEGWAVIKAKDLVKQNRGLPKWEVHPSPEPAKGDIDDSGNEYHAHAICCEDVEEIRRAIFFRYLFEKFGQWEPGPEREQKEIGEDNVFSILMKAVLWCKRRLFR